MISTNNNTKGADRQYPDSTISTTTLDSRDCNKIKDYHDKSYQEWTIGSGISEEITKKNLWILSDPRKINACLGRDIHKEWKGGLAWTVQYSIDIETGNKSSIRGQVKPEYPIQSDDGTEAKYLTSSKKVWDAVALRMPDPDYWDNVRDDISQPVVITEGAKKAGSLLTCGYHALALPGVWMGLISQPEDSKQIKQLQYQLKNDSDTDKKQLLQQIKDLKDKKDLVPNLKALCKPGRPITIVFDADEKADTCENVGKAIIQLADKLVTYECIVRVASWDPSLGKGIDDILVKHGRDKVSEIMNSAVPYAEWVEKWELQFPSVGDGKKSIPQASDLSADIAEKYISTIKYHNVHDQFIMYRDSVWIPVKDREILSRVIMPFIECNYEGKGFGVKDTKETLDLLKDRLFTNEFNPLPGYIALQDGVIDLSTMKFVEHSPHYQLTNKLPYNWADREKGMDLISNFLSDTFNGDKQLIHLWLCLLAAQARGILHLQRCVNLVGAGGTGKSTLAKLAQSLVGKENTITADLRRLETDNHATVSLVGKKLILVNDQGHYTGSVDTIKQIVGQDDISIRPLHKKGYTARIDAWVLIVSNQILQVNDQTSGWDRRIITIPCNNVVPTESRRDLDREFQPYLPALLESILSIPIEEVERTIQTANRDISTIRDFRNESLIVSNPLAAWVDRNIEQKKGSRTQVGTGDSNMKSIWLYANYRSWCSEVGETTPLSHRVFTHRLNDFLTYQLKWEVVKGRDEKGSYFSNIRIKDGSSFYPSSSITGESSPNLTVPDGWLTDSLTVQTLATDGSDGSDGLSQQTIYQSDLSVSSETTCLSNLSSKKVCHNKPSEPSDPSSIRVSTVSQPSANRQEPSGSVSIAVSSPPPDQDQDEPVIYRYCGSDVPCLKNWMDRDLWEVDRASDYVQVTYQDPAIYSLLPNEEREATLQWIPKSDLRSTSD